MQLLHIDNSRPELSARAALHKQLDSLAETNPERAAAEARDLLASLPNDDAYSRALAARALGIALVKTLEHEKAKSSFRAAHRLAGVQGDDALQADILNRLALCAYFDNDFEAALATSYEALEAGRRAGEALTEASALHTIGWVYENFGLYRDALESFLAELSVLEEHNVKDRRKVKTLNAAGVGYTRLEEFEKAVTYLKASLALATQEKDIEGQALALRNLGSVADDRQEHKRALHYYEQSFALYERIKEPYELARQYLALGKALANLERDDEAVSAFTQALVYLQRDDNVHLKIDVSLRLSELAERQGRADLALQRLQNALELSDEETAPADAYRVHRALAEGYKKRGETDRALAHFESFHTLKERVQREAEAQRRKGLLLQFDVERLRLERETYRLKHVELARAYAQLKELSVRDPLTNLYNRRYLGQELAQEIERSRRYERPLGLMLCDIDDFKQINDTFGHQVGDEVLITVAALFTGRVRTSDIVARYGGEEIVAVFPEIDLSGTSKLCEDLRKAVETHPWHKLHSDLRVTLSIGSVELSDSDDAESLLRRADNNMYEAKNSGKNRVCS